MKWATISLTILLGVGLFGVSLRAVTIGISIGYEVSGLILAGALTEVPIDGAMDLRAEVGFATQDLAGLMVVSMDLLRHWMLPPVDPYVGLGIGAALTPPPFSTGLVLEGIVGLRLVPSEVVRLFLQVRYLVRWSVTGWDDGPIFESGLLLHF